MKWTNKGREFDTIAKSMMEAGVKYYLWGAGIRGAALFESFKNKINIIGFIDNDISKQAKLFCGLSVFTPDSVLDSDVSIKIIVTSIWRNQIAEELSKYNFVENKNFFYGEEFSLVYSMYSNNELRIPIMHYIPTQKCTLKCKHCVLMMPRLKRPIVHSVEFIVNDFYKLFETVDYIDLLCITGGDSFLHPEFDNFFEIIASKYFKKKIGKFQVLTNCVILPNEFRLKLLKKYDAQVRFTDYGDFTKGKQKIKQMIDILKKFEIDYQYVKYDTWLDLGFPQKENGVSGDSELQKFFTMCNNTCQLYDNGKFYYCSLTKSADDLGYCKCGDGDFLNLHDEQCDNKKVVMEYLLGYSEKGYVELCRKCNGMFDLNKTEIPAGEQL